MGLVVLLIILALIFGGIGIFVEALWWMLIIAGALAIFSFVTGWRSRA